MSRTPITLHYFLFVVPQIKLYHCIPSKVRLQAAAMRLHLLVTKLSVILCVSSNGSPAAASGGMEVTSLECHDNPGDAIPVFYPDSGDEERSHHMARFVARIGGCGYKIPAVMARSLTTTKNINGSRATEVLYKGERVAFAPLGVLPRGNLANAATHFRIMKAVASSTLPDYAWVLIAEDDAQLQDDVAGNFTEPLEVAAMFRWSFAVAAKLGKVMVHYAACKMWKSGRSKFACASVAVPPDLADSRFSGLELATCRKDYRCAVAYAMPKWRAKVLVMAYQQLNSGDKSCPRDLWGTGQTRSECGWDPAFLAKYLAMCRGRQGMGTSAPCQALVVGNNLNHPTARHLDEHVGVIRQEKSLKNTHFKVRILEGLQSHT